jgi:hypothetical protein
MAFIAMPPVRQIQREILFKVGLLDCGGKH